MTTFTRAALVAALLALAGCAYRSADDGFWWRQATPQVKKEVTR
jgi:hypothetical protein